MTVGQLLFERAAKSKRRSRDVHGVQIVAPIMKELGLWDAEVLEGAISAPLVQMANGYCGTEFTVGGVPVGIERERVRIIVLEVPDGEDGR